MTLEQVRGYMVAELSGAATPEDLTTVPGRVRQRRLWSRTEKRALVDLANYAVIDNLRGALHVGA